MLTGGRHCSSERYNWEAVAAAAAALSRQLLLAVALVQLQEVLRCQHQTQQESHTAAAIAEVQVIAQRVPQCVAAWSQTNKAAVPVTSLLVV
jgi:hypothetical protein